MSCVIIAAFIVEMITFGFIAAGLIYMYKGRRSDQSLIAIGIGLTACGALLCTVYMVAKIFG